ncbi:response regulator [Burkholderia sp. FERM BP-3421]|nr:response regulator [Burkholderia sp. FERM BP-3421]WDD93713.1 response regulator [Burkholderia sp. FERM BP-3421]
MSSFVRQPMFHPVSVVFLDDSADFLDGLRGRFRDRELNRFFTRPRAALDFMTSRDRAVPVARIAGADYSEVEKGGSNALGRDALDDASRFEEVAAVVVDYEMPEIDGLRFLTSLEGAVCTRILLTGAAGDREAVDAFNAGLIDFYLRKSDPGMPGKLTAALAEAKKKHCALRGHISVHDIGATYCDPRVVRLLDERVARGEIVEYYWRPEQNAVLMFDDAGQASVFVAWDADEWSFQCDTAADAGAPSRLHRGMAERRIMPLFWPHQAYRPELIGVRSAEPLPVPEWAGASYCVAPLDADELAPAWLSFAGWRRAKRDAAAADGGRS